MFSWLPTIPSPRWPALISALLLPSSDSPAFSLVAISPLLGTSTGRYYPPPSACLQHHWHPNRSSLSVGPWEPANFNLDPSSFPPFDDDHDTNNAHEHLDIIAPYPTPPPQISEAGLTGQSFTMAIAMGWHKPDNVAGTSAPAIMVGLFVATGGLLFGYDTG